jgi:hypothetical protein
MSLLSSDSLEPQCSRAGCDSTATVAINWRNPKIHAQDRVKVWLACGDHTEYLREFLLARDFPVVVAPIGTEVTMPATPASLSHGTVSS